MQPQIFVSHSSKDDDFGVRLVEDLRHVLRDENAVWYDSRDGLSGGDTWWRKIVQELEARNVFIVILSPNAMASAWVDDEINIAWQRKNSPAKMRLIPVLYQPCKVRADLEALQMISFLPPTTYEVAFSKLLQALRIPVQHYEKNASRALDTAEDVTRSEGPFERSIHGVDWAGFSNADWVNQ